MAEGSDSTTFGELSHLWSGFTFILEVFIRIFYLISVPINKKSEKNKLTKVFALFKTNSLPIGKPTPVECQNSDPVRADPSLSMGAPRWYEDRFGE